MWCLQARLKALCQFGFILKYDWIILLSKKDKRLNKNVLFFTDTYIWNNTGLKSELALIITQALVWLTGEAGGCCHFVVLMWKMSLDTLLVHKCKRNLVCPCALCSIRGGRADGNDEQSRNNSIVHSANIYLQMRSVAIDSSFICLFTLGKVRRKEVRGGEDEEGAWHEEEWMSGWRMIFSSHLEGRCSCGVCSLSLLHEAQQRPCLFRLSFLTYGMLCLTRCEDSSAQQHSETSCCLFLTNRDIPAVRPESDLRRASCSGALTLSLLSVWTFLLVTTIFFLFAACRHVLPPPV